MDNSLVIALGITVVGMTLLFLALALFYGLLSLMTAVLESRSAKPEAASTTREAAATTRVAAAESDLRLHAAAIAVVLARAQTPAPQSAKGTTGESLSPWWSLHHQREVTRNPNVGRAP